MCVKKKLPYLFVDVPDLLSDGRLACLPPDARGGYVWLLCHSWLMGPLPDVPAQLATLSGLGPDGWAQHGASILALWEKTPAGWIEPARIEPARKRAQDISRKRRAAANSRHHPTPQRGGDANALQVQCTASSSLSSSSSSSSSGEGDTGEGKSPLRDLYRQVRDGHDDCARIRFPEFAASVHAWPGADAAAAIAAMLRKRAGSHIRAPLQTLENFLAAERKKAAPHLDRAAAKAQRRDAEMEEALHMLRAWDTEAARHPDRAATIRAAQARLKSDFRAAWGRDGLEVLEDLLALPRNGTEP